MLELSAISIAGVLSVGLAAGDEAPSILIQVPSVGPCVKADTSHQLHTQGSHVPGL